MKIELTGHSYLPSCRGVMGDTLEVSTDIGESMIARGAAKLWQPPKDKTKTVNERLADLESKVQSLLEQQTGKQ